MKTILVDAGKTLVVDSKINEEMYKLLEDYFNRKIILTNANDEEMLTSGLVDMPYEIFTLKHNPDKTDPAYFNTMLKEHNLRADDCIYFDHIKEAVESAKSVGIVSYFYDPEKKDIQALRDFLNSNL
jgi:HAD superfamily hydrolase (TIGR01509 family)